MELTEKLLNDVVNIDLLSEGIDWFKLIYSESQSKIAKRIKASDTQTLTAITKRDNIPNIKTAQGVQYDFAMKELAMRRANDNNNKNGDPRYTKDFNGYNKLNLDNITSEANLDSTQYKLNEMLVIDSNENKKDRLIESLETIYSSSQTKPLSTSTIRKMKIVSLVVDLDSKDKGSPNLLRYFVEINEGIDSRSMLDIKSLWESFVYNLTENDITQCLRAKVKCVKYWGACDIGNIYEGVWKQASNPNHLRLDIDSSLPGATVHPTIIYDKTTKDMTIPNNFELL